MSFVLVNISLFAVGFFEYPGFVKANDTLFQFFVVLDVLHNLEYVILEALLLDKLDIESVSAAQIFVLKTLVTHLKIVYNKIEVITDALEVFDFDLHLVNLLVK